MQRGKGRERGRERGKCRGNLSAVRGAGRMALGILVTNVVASRGGEGVVASTVHMAAEEEDILDAEVVEDTSLTNRDNHHSLSPLPRNSSHCHRLAIPPLRFTPRDRL